MNLLQVLAEDCRLPREFSEAIEAVGVHFMNDEQHEDDQVALPEGWSLDTEGPWLLLVDPQYRTVLSFKYEASEDRWTMQQ